jgi:hypothetical protein
MLEMKTPINQIKTQWIVLSAEKIKEEKKIRDRGQD